jgi:hypothetical protein
VPVRFRHPNAKKVLHGGKRRKLAPFSARIFEPAHGFQEVRHDKEARGSALPRASLSAHLRAGGKGRVVGSSPTLVTMPPSDIRASRCSLGVHGGRRGGRGARERDGSEASEKTPRNHSCGHHRQTMQRSPKTLASFPQPAPTPPAQPTGCAPARKRQREAQSR